MSTVKGVVAIRQVINRVILGLNLTPGKYPVCFRAGLKLFKENLPDGVDFDKFAYLTTNAQDIEHGVYRLIMRLKKKLKPFGYTIRRRTIYEIVPIEKNE
jgi:hypothetical protein